MSTPGARRWSPAIALATCLLGTAVTGACAAAGERDEADRTPVPAPTTGATGTVATTRPTAPPTTSSTSAPTTAPAYEVVTIDAAMEDAARSRVIPYRAYAPVGPDGPVPVILVSHGGAGNPRGHLAAAHLGTTFAAGGFLAVHIGHDRSAAGSRAVDDRPADVSFVLDRLAEGALALPSRFSGTPDLSRVGHTGHSFGAYTSHAVAGATYARTYRDDRIDAIAPISPQGPDQFGAFDRGRDDSTWTTVTIPVFGLVGGDEIDSNAVDTVVRPGWRLVPFDRYPGTSDVIRTVVADQGHSDMWRTGSDQVQAFIAEEILEFMLVYVAGDDTTDPCGIGIGDLPLASTEHTPGTGPSRLATCG